MNYFMSCLVSENFCSKNYKRYNTSKYTQIFWCTLYKQHSRFAVIVRSTCVGQHPQKNFVGANFYGSQHAALTEISAFVLGRGSPYF